MRVTVIDVAREARVSRTTVSNVFNSRAKYSEETRRAVLDAAKRLGYKPNLAAKSLITHKSNLIGLILPSYVDTNTLTTSPFYNIIMDGIYSVLQNETYFDLLINCVPNRAKLAQVSDWIDTRSVDGILAIGEYETEFLHELDARSIPVVLIDHYRSDFPTFSYIHSEDETGGYLAARRLIERGFQKIALCSVNASSLESSPVMQKRCDGFRRALREAGREEWALTSRGSPFEAGKYFARQMLEQGCDGAFCTEDMLAIGVLHFMLEKGVQVGQEFGLVGFDNLHITRQVHPELTTIDQNIFEKGEIAARTLLALLKDPSLPRARTVLSVRLIGRGTA